MTLVLGWFSWRASRLGRLARRFQGRQMMADELMSSMEAEEKDLRRLMGEMERAARQGLTANLAGRAPPGPVSAPPMSLSPQQEAARRRTFAIIAHPDAGKTTLTENLLLAGGAIRMAGAVKARGERRRTMSDWMKIERERGISVSASVMTFEYEDCVFNLLDTPGHEDFSEDTYRTLTAADSAIMVLDAAKGIEPQTLKLFEVCRLRDIPIITFINKMDREAQDPFELLDEIEQKLAMTASPLYWPQGSGERLRGMKDLRTGEFVTYRRTVAQRRQRCLLDRTRSAPTSLTS